MRDGLLKVEYPLIEENLSSIDDSMEKALCELNWTSTGKIEIWQVLCTIILINSLLKIYRHGSRKCVAKCVTWSTGLGRQSQT